MSSSSSSAGARLLKCCGERRTWQVEHASWPSHAPSSSMSCSRATSNTVCPIRACTVTVPSVPNGCPAKVSGTRSPPERKLSPKTERSAETRLACNNEVRDGRTAAVPRDRMLPKAPETGAMGGKSRREMPRACPGRRPAISRRGAVHLAGAPKKMFLLHRVPPPTEREGREGS